MLFMNPVRSASHFLATLLALPAFLCCTTLAGEREFLRSEYPRTSLLHVSMLLENTKSNMQVRANVLLSGSTA